MTMKTTHNSSEQGDKCSVEHSQEMRRFTVHLDTFLENNIIIIIFCGFIIEYITVGRRDGWSEGRGNLWRYYALLNE